MFTCTLAQYVAHKTNVVQQFTPQKHYRLPHPNQDTQWRNAMYNEYNVLVKNGTWLLVPRRAGVNMVRSMWLFKHKFHVDGTLSRYKARLVANGSSQQLGVDFDETFSLVVKSATIRTVLSLAMSRQWPIYQLDVKNAFLNSDLSETVYMHQPLGFVDSRYPHHGSQVAYLLIYVDDIILTASSPTLLQQIIASLHKEFDMTDLGALNYFFGIFADRSFTGLFLSQRKYALQLLERAHMVNCNPSRTPVDTKSKLGPEGVPVQDPTLYRSLARGLQYLTFTRPDLSRAVQQVCLYMHDPREPHFAALKRILRYFRGTVDFGLQLYASATTSLVGYTDVDWAGCPSTRTSTLGYCVFLGDNLLSWSAKRQHTLSRSSAKAEYRGVANVVAETAWLRNLLRELHSPLSTATLVYRDNSALDALCKKFHIPDTVHPELLGHNDRIGNSPVDILEYFQINLSQFSVIAAAKNDHFFWVDASVFPIAVPWHNSITLKRDPHPMPADFDPEVCNFLADNPAPFRKFPKPFLCFVGISWYYDLDENCYPTFWDDEDEEMDLFAFIYYADLTKMRIGEKEVIEREVPLLELTAGRVVPLACVDPPENQNKVAQDAGADVEGNGGTGDGATVASHTEEGGHVVELGGIDISENDEAQAIVANKPKVQNRRRRADGASGSSHPPKKLREDHGTVGGVGASTGGKSLVAVQELFEHSTLNVDVGVTEAATVPFVTSFVTPTPEREEGGYTDSVTGPNLPTQPATERFVVLSDSSNHSSTNVASDEVTSVVRSSMPPPLVLTAAIATAVTFGATSALVGELGTGQENFYVSQDMDYEMLRKTHFPKWDVSNESALDESNVCRSLVDHLAPPVLFSQLREVRMRLEQVLRGKQRLEEIEAANVARAVELESLKEQSVALESATVAKDSEIAKLTRDLSSLQLSYDDLSIRDYSLENEKDKLVDQVSELEATCSGLRDSDLMSLALHMDEEFYHGFPTVTNVEKLYLHHEENHGFPGMLGSLDSVVSQDLWIWHAFFGVDGSNNDINVLYQSPLFNDLKTGRAPEIPFVANGVTYPSGYYLVDGIYPELAPLVKTVPEPADDDHKRIVYKQKQESARKDVERAFGVLKKKWAILANPTRALKKERIINMMYTCIILHNMIRKYKKYAISPKWFREKMHKPDDPLRNEEQVQHVMRWIRSDTI
ncbi:ribonuclease H-like domain-containing protein [Tanacetum coccineum]